MRQKFENIKGGDTVYTKEIVRIGDTIPLLFYVPITVEKVTEKTFIAAGNRYYKDDGHLFRKTQNQLYGQAYLPGEVEDQSKQRDEALKKAEAVQELRKLARELPCVDFDFLTIDVIQNLITALKNALTEEEK